MPVVDIEVVLDDPAVGDLKVPSVRLAVADRRHDARWLTRFENDHDGIEVCAFEIWIDEVVAAAFRGVGNRYVALLRPPFQPALKLVGNVPQHVPAHRVKLPVGVEKANHAFRLLERLNQSVQQDAIKATVLPSNAVPVVSVEGVHEVPPADPSSAG